MAIVWGTKRVEKIFGYAADFCPVCREIRPFRVSRVGMVSHIYYLPVGKENSIRHIGECQKCHIKKLVEPQKYKAFDSSSLSDLEGLIQRTFPNLREAYAERLEIEQQIKEHHIFMPAEREVLLMEPFFVLTGRVQDRYANTKFDRESGIGCLGTMMLPGIFFFTSAIFSDNTLILIMFILTVLGCIGLVYTVIQLMLAPGRFIRREIMPILARALLPLNPTQSEIARCLAQCRAKGLKIGKIKEEKLLETIQALRQTS